MTALTTEQILQEEAKAIHGRDLSSKTGAELYRELHALNSAALCLSGGGIRSAAFALGVIQALATWPRTPPPNVAAEDSSILTRFQYLSTVSGGGYIGSWLSAWVTRAGFPVVWRNLVGRPLGSDIEPPVISWLRSYSNYLTPKLGLGSGDTLAAVVLILRNLALNWLIILPALCVVLLVAKFYAFAVAWFSYCPPDNCGLPTMIPALAGAAALVVSLWFGHTQRPAHNDSSAAARGVRFFLLAPSVLSGLLFSFALASQCAYASYNQIPAVSWTGESKALIGVVCGLVIYILAWLLAFPFWKIWKSVREALWRRRWRDAWSAFKAISAWRDVGRDIFGVVIAGLMYGLVAALGVHVYQTYFWESGVSLFHGAVKFPSAEILLVVLTVPWALASSLLAEIIFLGLTNREKDSDADREWYGRASGYVLLTALLWLIVMFLIFLAATVASDLFEKVWAWATGLGAGGIAAWLGKSGLTPAKQKGGNGKTLSLNTICVIGAAVFAVTLIVMTSAILDQILLGTNLIESAGFHRKIPDSGYPEWPGDRWLVIGLGAALALAWAASFFVNINRFSLHALYRNRLIRAFLGASHVENRRANPFTDFDDRDNPRMFELWPPKEFADDMRRDWQPFHVVNVALNVVSTKRLAWQERKAETFTISPLHSGSACGRVFRGADGVWRGRGAYRSSETYGDPRGISLGTALTISGAAASPNMGYHSSPALSFLMTMFNVRLGWWLGNPAGPYSPSEGPNLAILPLLNEMIGNTTDESNFVNLSDGGHFENLGLFEMVRRRCRLIVVSDGGCDPDFAFEDLGNAVRKIAIDLGVTITFHGLSVLKSRAQEDRAGRREQADEPPTRDPHLYAIGAIDYGSGLTGTVLYIKAAYHKASVRNAGVRSYAIANPDFPHQSTGDQFFSESQFESYRALGFEVTDTIMMEGAAALPNPTLAAIVDRLRNDCVNAGRP